MIKKYTALLVLGLLVVHLTGFYVYFVVRLGEVRMEMRQKLSALPDEDMEIVRVPQKEFRASWLEELEMKWQGRMYDIARVEREGETILVYCLHDEDEDNLLSFIAGVVETSRQDSQQAPDSVVQFLTLEYVVSMVLVPQIKELPSPDPVTGYTVFKSSSVPDPIAPPPRA